MLAANRSFFLLVLLLSARSLSACWWFPPTRPAEVVPASPLSSEEVLIRLHGDWPSSCVPIGSAVSVIDRDVFFDVTAHPPAICLAVIAPWSQSQTLPPLAPGTYNLHARLVGDGSCAETYTLLGQFTVSDHQFALDVESVRVDEGATASFDVALTSPLDTVEVSVTVETGDSDISVQSGAILTFDAAGFSEPQTVVLAAAPDDDYHDGSAVIRISAPGFLPARITAVEADADRPEILHVDADANGENTGLGWANAFVDLQDALALAAQYPGDIREIRVAEGVYRPAPPLGGRHESFRIVAGTSLLGGYGGFDSPDPDRRDILGRRTILSGDLNGDDGPDFSLREDNSMSVVDARDADASTVLDGFVITGGDGGVGAGGVYLMFAPSSLTMRNCIVAQNRANYGGGIRVHDGSPTFVNCVFFANRTMGGRVDDGGGLYVAGEGRTTLIHCTFLENRATEDGGGLCNLSAGTRASHCIFWGNADGGGADESAQVFAGGGGEFDDCCIQGFTGGLMGEGSFGEDPRFRDAKAGDFHLLFASPCIDRGDPDFSPDLVETDIDGDPRVVAGRVDIGADEVATPDTPRVFRRGFVNDDGLLDMADPVFVLMYMYVGGPAPACRKSADVNDDGQLEAADVVRLLEYLFLGSLEPAGPFGECGTDPTADELTCWSFPRCE